MYNCFFNYLNTDKLVDLRTYIHNLASVLFGCNFMFYFVAEAVRSYEFWRS